MDVARDARRASRTEGDTTMADDTTTTLRRCSGSARFGIEAHDAPVEEFPRQPSQKDGLGRMCKVHWNQYTRGLAREAKARKAAAASDAAPAPEPDVTMEPAAPTPRERSRRQPVATPQPGAPGDAG
jgi:hypothetical protein